MFNATQSENTLSREEINNYLSQSDAQGGFSSLGADERNSLLDAASKLTGMEQSEALQRLRTMDEHSAASVMAQLLSGQGPMREANQGDVKNYTVKSGDSLFKISRAYNIGLQALIAANPQIKNPDLIHPGQIIHIP